MRTSRLIAIVAALFSCGAAWAADWTPAAWTKEQTVELQTNCPDEGKYAFPVWVVVIDNQAYVRLGSRAVGRVACNQTKPYLGIKIAGQQFDHVKGVEAPEKAEAVAKAMAEKYTSDIIVHLFSHPLTLRLVPE